MSNSWLFVYGTLRRGFDNPYAQLLRGRGAYVQEGQMQGYLYDVGSYPCAVYAPEGSNYVRGEIWQLADFEKDIAAFDAYEGIYDPSPEYERQLVPIAPATGAAYRCHVYLWRGAVEGLRPIAHGDYERWMFERLQHLP